MAFCRISVLADNFVKKPILKAEHGFSCLIQSDVRNILFDTGTDNTFARNASAMNIELYGIDDIVISHGHYDHTSGLNAALNVAHGARIILHPEATRAKYHQEPNGLTSRYIGMPDSTLNVLKRAESEYRVKFVDSQLWDICPSIKLFTPPQGPEVTGQWPFRYEDDHGELQIDEFNDEISLLLEGDASCALITGCSHRGIVNIIRHATTISTKPLKYIIGGTHLDGEAETKLIAAAEFLQTLDAAMYFGHCTGMNGYSRLYALLGDKMSPLGVGTEIDCDL